MKHNTEETVDQIFDRISGLITDNINKAFQPKMDSLDKQLEENRKIQAKLQEQINEGQRRMAVLQGKLGRN